ncbi:MAG: hypothetical protein ACRD3F_00410 [Acidobacteriaceae bacterium]
MTSEQLQNVRAERWRQKSNPVLTAEDAKAWIEDIGLCLFLPHRHFLAAAPSFVEAALGSPSEAPGREALENARALMRRLAADAALVPLNLFGNSGQGGPASDQPDFLCSRSTLPYIFSLTGGRNWKSGPGAKASPLMTETWTLLNDGEARTAAEIQTALGRELTEAAVLRALAELWNGLRVIPVFDGDLTRWELTQARFAAEMTASQKVAQTTALSALVSLYLDGAVAASQEEIETFLSPLTARSRVREVVNGLSATRQLGLVSVGAQPLLHVAGALPEFAEEEPAKAEPREARQERAERKPYERKPFGPGSRTARTGGGQGRPPERGERPFPRRDFKKGRERPAPRDFTKGRPGERRERPAAQRGFNKERPGERRERPAAGEGSFEKRERTERLEQRQRRAEGGGNFPKRKFGGDRERPWREREERGSARPGSRGEARPERRPGDGERRPYGKKSFEKSGRPFGARPFDRERPSSGGGKFPPKKFGKGAPKPWQRGERPAGEGDRPFRPRREEERGGERRGSKFGGAGKPGEKRPFFRERPAKAGGEDQPRRPRTGERERPANRAGGGFSKSGGRSFGKSGRPGFKSSGKPGFKSSGKPGFKSSGKPGFKSGGRPALKSGGRPAFKSEVGSDYKKAGFGKSARPFGKSSKPFGKSAGPSGRSGKPASGRAKPGGFKPPFRKRKKQEGEE